MKLLSYLCNCLQWLTVGKLTSQQNHENRRKDTFGKTANTLSLLGEFKLAPAFLFILIHAPPHSAPLFKCEEEQKQHRWATRLWEPYGKALILLSLVSACIYCSVSVYNPSLHKLRVGICSLLGTHRPSAAASQSMGSNIHLQWGCNLEYGQVRSCSKCHAQGCRQMSAGDGNPSQQDKDLVLFFLCSAWMDLGGESVCPQSCSVKAICPAYPTNNKDKTSLAALLNAYWRIAAITICWIYKSKTTVMQHASSTACTAHSSPSHPR